MGRCLRNGGHRRWTNQVLRERQWSLKDDWIQVVQPEPLPETWAAVRVDGLHYRLENATNFAQAEKMSKRAYGRPSLAIIHVWTDADGDHAEIERVAT